MNSVWSDLHKNYKDKDWIDKPSLFAETVSHYLPKNAKVLELGAGQAQDSRFFADLGHAVTSTDISEEAQDLARAKLSDEQSRKIDFGIVDLQNELPYEDDSYDVVYAHLSIHYFDWDTTVRLIGEIQRVLKKGGILAFFVNSTSDPEYGTGNQIEKNYFQINKAKKRYFDVGVTRQLTEFIDTILLDNLGETYKDSDKGVHNLIRYIGRKKASSWTPKTAIPLVAGIVQREKKGEKELLVQTRWKKHADPLYSGTLEFPAGVMDKLYEDVYTTLEREILEETGLKLKSVIDDQRTKTYSPKGSDEVFGFKPFYCTQQLRDGKPHVGFVFLCEVEDGEPVSQLSEAKDGHWIKASELKSIVMNNPEQIFGLELPALLYYFDLD